MPLVTAEIRIAPAEVVEDQEQAKIWCTQAEVPADLRQVGQMRAAEFTGGRSISVQQTSNRNFGIPGLSNDQWKSLLNLI